MGSPADVRSHRNRPSVNNLSSPAFPDFSSSRLQEITNFTLNTPTMSSTQKIHQEAYVKSGSLFVKNAFRKSHLVVVLRFETEAARRRVEEIFGDESEEEERPFKRNKVETSEKNFRVHKLKSEVPSRPGVLRRQSDRNKKLGDSTNQEATENGVLKTASSAKDIVVPSVQRAPLVDTSSTWIQPSSSQDIVKKGPPKPPRIIVSLIEPPKVKRGPGRPPKNRPPLPSRPSSSFIVPIQQVTNTKSRKPPTGPVVRYDLQQNAVKKLPAKKPAKSSPVPLNFIRLIVPRFNHPLRVYPGTRYRPAEIFIADLKEQAIEGTVKQADVDAAIAEHQNAQKLFISKDGTAILARLYNEVDRKKDELGLGVVEVLENWAVDFGRKQRYPGVAVFELYPEVEAVLFFLQSEDNWISAISTSKGRLHRLMRIICMTHMEVMSRLYHDYNDLLSPNSNLVNVPLFMGMMCQLARVWARPDNFSFPDEFSDMLYFISKQAGVDMMFLNHKGVVTVPGQLDSLRLDAGGLAERFKFIDYEKVLNTYVRSHRIVDGKKCMGGEQFVDSGVAQGK